MLDVNKIKIKQQRSWWFLTSPQNCVCVMMSLSYLSLPGAVVPLYILKKTHISSSFNLISNYLNGGQFALLIISLLYIQADMHMVPVRNQWLIYSFNVI